MVSKRLLVNPIQTPMTIHDFAWHQSPAGPRSFRVNVEPSLIELGTVPTANRDAVWLATNVFLTDRTVRRTNIWGRRLEISVPSADPDTWNGLAAEIEDMLCFLTSDQWTVTFVQQVPELPEPLQADAPEFATPDVVCLFSGGADSVCGAVKALADGRSVILVSHSDFNGHHSIQSDVVDELKDIFGVDIPHVRVTLGRSKRQLGGARFPDEPSRRSRSLLFITLGLAVASAHGAVPVWISENGFVSLNPPLAPERHGTLSTRTTHPDFLRQLRGIMRAAGAHSSFTTPYSNATKGEMFSSLADTIGQEKASALLSKSHSCAHLRRAKKYGRKPTIQCGVCLGCLVRRGAFIASGLEDQSTYLVTDLDRESLDNFLTPKPGPTRTPVETIVAMRYGVGRRFDMADVVALNFADSYGTDSALDLIRRGFQELALVDLP